MAGHTVIVNCAPVGMFPKVISWTSLRTVYSNHFALRFVVNPNEKHSLKERQSAGAVTKNGLEMLLQAFAAWEIWNK